MILVDQWARAYSKVRLMDAWAAEHGWLDEDGNPPAMHAHYLAALNTCGRAVGQLRQVLADRAAVDDRHDSALQALIAEGRKTRAGRGAEE